MRDLWRTRLDAETQKIRSLPRGAVYTMAFLGIHSGPSVADTTLTALALPEYSGRFGLGEMDFGAGGNGGLLPNDNWRLRAFLGWGNAWQVRMALVLASVASHRGVRLNLIAHSNGVNGAARFLRRWDGVVENALVIAPNTRSAATMRTIAARADAFQLLTSDYDERLRQAWLGHRPVAFWKRVLPEQCVVESQQSGHGAQCYLLALSARAA